MRATARRRRRSRPGRGPGTRTCSPASTISVANFTDFHELESQNWLMGIGHAPGRQRPRQCGRDAVVRAVHGAGARIAAGVPDRRNVPAGAAHRLPASARSVHVARRRYARTVEARDASSRSTRSDRRRSGRRSSCTARRRRKTRRRRSRTTYWTPRTSRRASSRRHGGRRVELEGSWFRGREPDENRTDIDFGALDSWALRGTWQRGPWTAQVSGAQLTKPEWVEPFYDMARLTASVAFTGSDGRLAAFLAWGQNREFHGNLDAYLFEATLRPRPRHAWYTRAELVTKDILGAGGRHPRLRSLPPDVPGGRLHRRLRLRCRRLARRALRARRRRDGVLRPAESEGELRSAGVLPRVSPLPAEPAAQSTPGTDRPRRRARSGPSLDDDPPSEGRIELIRVVVEAARAGDVEDSGRPALAGIQEPDIVDRGTIRCAPGWDPTTWRGPCVGIEERHPATDGHANFDRRGAGRADHDRGVCRRRARRAPAASHGHERGREQGPAPAARPLIDGPRILRW